MGSMCHYCGGELVKAVDERKQENKNPLKPNSGYSSESCRYCREKQEKESRRHEDLNRFSTPSITPTNSLSSSDRSFSSDFSVDGNPYDRGYLEECTSHSSREDMGSWTKSELQDSSLELPGTRMDASITTREINNKRVDGDIMRDVEIMQIEDRREAEEGNIGDRGRSSKEEHEASSADEDQTNTEIWEPPEPENPDDELGGGIADNDEDDEECSDGTAWRKSNSLSDDRDGHNKSYKLKEEKQRVMQEVINRKFTEIVCQLLNSVGVTLSTVYGENWVDIVTALSWEAASLLKSAVINGKPVDTTAYIKVKCIATGSRSQSQVIKGLVFKKHAAHKHMPTKYKNPRILLVRGVLGQSSDGLSSFKSMVQDKDYVKPVADMIESCHPNVILVEKSVSRVVQESILSKGVTLVYDMKLHRLERVARCIGSPILSSDTLTGQQLKQCDSFHIEKFVEEHNAVGEGGKKPAKTLMFLEGCPTCLGCTILLKGSHSDELKRIKEVVQYAVVLAYHLMLESSFLIDQQTMFSTIPFVGAANVPLDKKFPALETGKVTVSCLDDSIEELGNVVDIPVSSGFQEQGSYANGEARGAGTENGAWDEDSVFSYEPYNPFVLSGLASVSDSIMKVSKLFGNRFPSQSLSAYLGLGQFSKVVPVSVVSEESDDSDAKTEGNCKKDLVVDDAQHKHLLGGAEALISVRTDDDSGANPLQSEKDGKIVLDSQSILVLTSKRNARKGIICEQSHFSHIMFYKHFDAPLGKFLQENLFNQESQCKTCEDVPEDHFYYYTHHSKHLTIQIKQLCKEKSLPGGAKGKLWMWSRCGKCKAGKGISKSTKRVLISTAAWSLSFGKFLELSFSEHSLSSRLSSCGHSLDWDFLHFFGQGSMVAMFRYSQVTTYNVSLPPLKLEFRNSIRTRWLEKEFENVFTKGISLFEEFASFLKWIRHQSSSASVNLQGSFRDLSDIEDMLKKERFEFEANIKNAFEKAKSPDDVFHKLLSLNRMRWELLLEACIWNRRFHSLLSPDPVLVATRESEKTAQQAPKAKLDGTVGARVDFDSGDKASDSNGVLKVLLDSPFEGNEIASKDIPIYGPGQDYQDEGHHYAISDVSYDDERQTLGVVSSDTYAHSVNHDSGDESHMGDDIHSNDCQEVDKRFPISTDPGNINCVMTEGSLPLGLARSSEWFWLPFPEIRHLQVEDLENNYLSNFESVNSSTQENFPTTHQIISEEGSRLHVSLGDDHFLVSDYEDELSSLIACALALLRDRPASREATDEVTWKENGMPVMKTKHRSLDGFLDPDSVHSNLILPLEDSRFHSFDGVTLLESLSPPECLRREVSFGSVKSLGKSKYTVLCLYADQFRDLRKRCCPSELDYIASLSRCKQWDAKGGKSKSVFAKTIDGRFIIKEIKKTEYDSFVKFARDYFKYMNDSYDLGNQTCLAKVLGIYQVVIRQAKSGKEIRHDLMVMENLNFGRTITRQYDLKGALHARYTTTDGAGDVLLDQNFVDDMNASPLYVSNTSKRILQRAVWNDTSFLNSINVMDYSLLVGVDAQRQELVCGIIDYLRQYTWDKQLETWVKSSLVVPKNVLPTVISPENYKKRFRKFMSTHFLSVPDHWCTQGSSDPCELCSSTKDDKLSELKQQKKGGINVLSTKVHS